MARAKYHPQIGQRFSHLTVAAEPFKKGRLRRVVCTCDCGASKEVTVCRLYYGEVTSCGCEKVKRTREMGLRNKKHGHSSGTRSPTYLTWQSMKLRCENPATKSYNRYGGRGVSVCARWSGEGGFQNFLDDMGERPEGLTLDRIDPDGDYQPDNCRWADWATQHANKGTLT